MSPTYRPNVNCINRRIHSRACFLEFLFALRTFLFLLYSCQSAASLRRQGLFQGKKQAVLRDSLHILARMNFFVKHFLRKITTFFGIFSGNFSAAAKPRSPILYIVCTRYSMYARMHAYTANEKINDPAGKNGIAGKNYLQPPHVLQLPEHFLTGLPVAENISPDHSRRAAAPQTGQTTPSSNFFTNSSNCLPHSGQTYCKTGISHLRIR